MTFILWIQSESFLTQLNLFHHNQLGGLNVNRCNTPKEQIFTSGQMIFICFTCWTILTPFISSKSSSVSQLQYRAGWSPAVQLLGEIQDALFSVKMKKERILSHDFTKYLAFRSIVDYIVSGPGFAVHQQKRTGEISIHTASIHFCLNPFIRQGINCSRKETS